MSSGSIRRHNNRFHKDTNFPCNTCGKTFSTNDDVKRHSQRMHSKSCERVSCDICEKEILGKANLLCHMKRLHNFGKPNKILSCDKCDKTFHTPSGLREHIEIIHYERKFSCDICNISVASVSSMEQHVLIHQEKSDISHDCINCEKKFKCKKVLKSHIKNHHKNLHYYQT